MRYIKKGKSPVNFERWKEQERPTSWSHLLGKKIKSPEYGVFYYSKEELRVVLLEEQNRLCCYCENMISNSPLTAIIDHLRPRLGDQKTELLFDYYNLVLSCRGGQKHREKSMGLHCDSSKGNSLIPISPLNPKCMEHIQFRLNGAAYSHTLKGEATISILNLDCNKLINLRRNAIDGVIYNDQGRGNLISKDDANLELKKIKSGILFYPFISSIKSALQKLI